MSFTIQIGPGYILPQDIEALADDLYLINEDDADEIMLSEDIVFTQENTDKSIVDVEQWVKENSEATDADAPLAREGFSMGKIVHHNSFALHIAAREGDLKEIQRLHQEGYDINKENNRSTRPLHFAAFAGKFEAVKLLVNLGAEVNDPGYGGNTALHLALKKHHYDVAQHLVSSCKASPLDFTDKGENAFHLILNNLEENLLNHQNGNVEHLDNILQTIEVFANHSVGFCYSSEKFVEADGQGYFAPMPVLGSLNVYTSLASTLDVKNKITELAQKVAKLDPSYQSYLEAKNLLHHYPTGKFYDFKVAEDVKIAMNSQEHYGLLTTELAAQSLEAYVSKLKQGAPTLESEVMTDVRDIFKSGYDFISNASLPETAKKALTLYNQGETVLLPSGWNGHFVDVIVSKKQGLYVTANSGERYLGELSDELDNGDTAGLIFYHLQEPHKINESFFQDILNNQDQMKLEFENQFMYSTFAKLFEIERDDQKYGNCGWESHRDAVEGVILIELLNRHVGLDEAKALSHQYYEKWDLFHGNYIIEQYMAHNPSLPVEALIDIFKELHQDNSQLKEIPVVNHLNGQVKANIGPAFKPNLSPNDEVHAQKIVDTLLSKHYEKDFKDWLTQANADPKNKSVIDLFHDKHQVDTQALVKESHVNEVAIGHPVDVVVADTQHQAGPHFNIAHLMMTEPMLVECF